MPRFSSLIAAGMLGLLAACADSRTPQAFDQRMSGFVGRPEAELVAGLGVPSRTYEADGRRLLQWDFLQPSTTPAVYPSIGLGFSSFNFGRSSGSGVGLGTGLGVGPVGGAPLGCSVVFATQGGTVQSFTRNGPGCIA